MTKKLKDKIALITGASRGLGAALAQRLAAEGAHVILTARTISGLESVDDSIKKIGGKATLVPFDITDYNKIDELGRIIHERFGKLDILIANAAELGQVGPVQYTDCSIFEKVISINLIANFRLIRSMDALLKASNSPRAIFVSSQMAESDTPFYAAYSASKAALQQMAKIYAYENQNSKLRINIIDPGVMATEMMKKALPGLPITNWTDPNKVTDIFVELCSESCTDTGKLYLAQK